MRTLLAAALALLVAVPADAARPVPPPPTLVAILPIPLPTDCFPSLLAVASDGRVLIYDCNLKTFVLAAQLPGTPVGAVSENGYPGNFVNVAMANGDVHRFGPTSASLPWAFSYMGNVFAGTFPVGPLARGPFPSAPLLIAPPGTTGPVSTVDDMPAPVRPGAEK